MSLARLNEALGAEARHFSPFFILGDPTPPLSLELCLAAVRAGAGMLELGLAFSDPVADGPAIQAAGRRARETTPDRAFALMAELRSRVSVPFNLLVYGNLIHRRGARRFARDARQAGASSILCPDVPHAENRRLCDIVKDEGLGFVEFCSPRAHEAHVTRLSERSNCMIYVAGRVGVTGSRADPDPASARRVEAIARASARAVCVGFGLETPGQLRSVYRAGASVAVVGSALARIIADHAASSGRPRDPDALVAAVEARCRLLAAVAGRGREEEVSPC